LDGVHEAEAVMTFARKLQEWRESRQKQKEENLRALAIPTRSLHKGVLTRIADEAVPVPKTSEHRNPRLLALARGQECLFRIPGICIGGTETTRKAQDEYSVWGCAACHHWYDQSKGPTYEQKQDAFRVAHARQVLAWRLKTLDAQCSDADQDACAWALAWLALDEKAEKV
jgi:hypothetical protein